MAEFMSLIETAPWLLYLAVLVAPFVQEDAAVIGAATLSAGGQGEASLLFAAVLIGLTASDIWKYCAGAYLPRLRVVRNFLQSSRTEAVRSAVVNRLARSLVAARFIPGTRIPMYVACGLFRVDFGRFLLVLILAGAFYIGVAFALMTALGDAGGDYFSKAVPLGVASIVLIAIAVSALRRRADQAQAATSAT